MLTLAVKEPSMLKTTVSVLGGRTVRKKSTDVWSPLQQWKTNQNVGVQWRLVRNDRSDAAVLISSYFLRIPCWTDTKQSFQNAACLQEKDSNNFRNVTVIWFFLVRRKQTDMQLIIKHQQAVVRKSELATDLSWNQSTNSGIPIRPSPPPASKFTLIWSMPLTGCNTSLLTPHNACTRERAHSHTHTYTHTPTHVHTNSHTHIHTKKNQSISKA